MSKKAFFSKTVVTVSSIVIPILRPSRALETPGLCNASQKRSMVLSLFFLIFLICGSHLARESSPIFRIGVIGDQTGTDNETRSSECLNLAIRFLATQSVDIVLHVGDLVESRDPEETRVLRFKDCRFLRTFHSLLSLRPVLIGLDSYLPNIAWGLTPGDHDVNPPEFVPNSKNRTNEWFFRQLMVDAGLPLTLSESGPLYYSFDSGPSLHVVSLYALEHLWTDPRWGDVFFSHLSSEQKKWLESDLSLATQENQDLQCVVMLHQPLWYRWEDWIEVHEILRSSECVTTVIAGHYHYSSAEFAVDEIHYYVVGATGGEIMNSTVVENVVTLLDVGKPSNSLVTFGLGDCSGSLESVHEISTRSRAVMSRLLALNYMLLDGIPHEHPIFYSKEFRTLVSNCSSLDKALLPISCSLFGNPLDVPIRVEMSFESLGVEIGLSNVTWCSQCSPLRFSHKSSCSGSFSASVEAGYATMVSNNELVQLGRCTGDFVSMEVVALSLPVSPTPSLKLWIRVFMEEYETTIPKQGLVWEIRYC